MATSPAPALHLIVRCLAVAVIADVADGKSAGLRHVVELGCGLLALFCPGVGTALVLVSSCLAVTLLQPFERWYVHHYIAAALHAVVCGSALVAAIAARRLPTAHELLELVRTPFRVIACAVFFAGLAKLNRDFLDPRISCAGVYYLWMRQWPGLGVLPDSDGAKQVAIALAAGAELLGPVLLLARRTRPVGLALVWALTLALCANTYGVYVEFIGLFWVASLFWIDPAVLERAARSLAGAGPKSERVKSVPWAELRVAGAVGLALLVEQRRGLGVGGPWVYAWLGPALVMVLVVTGAVVRAAWVSGGAVEPVASAVLRSRLRIALLIVPVLVLGNEARVYLGWPEGRPALRMAANLIVNEHETNHLVLSRVPRLALGGPWGVVIEAPYPMRQKRVLCDKAEPGKSRGDTQRHMHERLAHDRLASGG